MIPTTFPPKEEIARLTARALLEIKAVHFNAETPFTLASASASSIAAIKPRRTSTLMALTGGWSIVTTSRSPSLAVCTTVVSEGVVNAGSLGMAQIVLQLISLDNLKYY